MSRLIDNLTRIRQNEPQPMGFMLTRAVEKPKLQLVAYVTTNILEKVSNELDYADAVLIDIVKAEEISVLDKVCQSKNGIPSGGWIKASNTNTFKKALNIACDFIVFPATASLTVTQKEKMGRILEIDASLTEVLLRTTNDLPIDAVLAFNVGEENSITINRLMVIQRLSYLISKPILVSIPANLTGPELQAIWDIGISGVVVELVDEKSIEKLAELRKAINNLTPPAFRKKSRTTAIIPRMQQEPEKPEEEEEE